MSNKTEDFGCVLTVNGAGNQGTVDIVLCDVEQQFLGFSLTGKTHRVAAELHDLDQITKLRNSLSAYLMRKGRE